ncbi:MAG: sodium:proline symporter, partial [candidate division NC10 bacterium]
NAWSEVSAMAAALVFSLVAQFGFGLSADDPRDFARLLLVTTVATTIVWLAVTYLTRAEPADRLRAFYRRVRPGGPGWTAIEPEASRDAAIGTGLVQWVLGCLVVYLGLFGIGGLVLGRPLQGAVAVVAAVLLTWYLVTATRAATRSETSVV